jgi:hypothetical protein
MRRFSRLLLAQAAAIFLLSPLVAQEKTPPKTWVDKDTGHRVYRLTDEPGSSALYFNFDAYTPDGRQMVYTSPAGIHMLELATRHTRLLVPAEGKSRRIVAVGRVTGAIYFSEMSTGGLSTIYSANSTTGAVRKPLLSRSTPTRPSPQAPTSKATTRRRSTEIIARCRVGVSATLPHHSSSRTAKDR